MNTKLLAQVPKEARRVLDVGCASGEFGAALKERQECVVTGIELDQEIAQQAIQNINQVLVGDVANIAPLLPRWYYDVVILGDVIEHLVDPVPILEALKLCLASGGVMLFSVPNVCHWSVVWMLLRGQWNYSPGLVSPSHLRFYTKASFKSLMKRVGLSRKLVDVIEVGDVPDAIKKVSRVAGLNGLAKESAMYQMIFQSHQREKSPLVSIVIPVHNVWEQTRECLLSIQEHTPQNYEIVIVDNASTDETVPWLQGLDGELSALHTIHNAENESYAHACNQGIEKACGEFIVIMNNDIVVTDGWLGKMLTAMERTGAGIVGPMSDYVAGAQHLNDFVYQDNGQLAEFARRVYYTELSNTIETQAVVGFCMLVKRDVFDQIGLFDEQFINGYEESDFCLRAGDAGFKIVVARDTFIHHEGSQTFIVTDIDYWGLIEENHQKFVAKWPGRIPGHIKSAQASGWFFRPVPRALPVLTFSDT
jgi:GT2 family glycosyltransferase/SAM-dependent methyltransferase